MNKHKMKQQKKERKKKKRETCEALSRSRSLSFPHRRSSNAIPVVGTAYCDCWPAMVCGGGDVMWCGGF
jgi:hypothetical protein